MNYPVHKSYLLPLALLVSMLGHAVVLSVFNTDVSDIFQASTEHGLQLELVRSAVDEAVIDDRSRTQHEQADSTSLAQASLSQPELIAAPSEEQSVPATRAKPEPVENGVWNRGADTAADSVQQLEPQSAAELPVLASMPSLPASSQQENQQQLLQLIYTEINKHKRYPYLAIRQRREGRVKVNFSMHPDGQVSNVAVVESSRYSTLDHAATLAVQSISPFGEAAAYLDRVHHYDVDIEFRLN